MPGEEALYKQIGAVLDAAAKDPEVMKTLKEAAYAADPELIAPMMEWRLNGQPAGNGWTSPANNGAFGTDYYHRTGAVKADPYDNKRNETMYFYTDNDTGLQQLVGESSYAVTFAKGELPPIKGFWSLTMYDPEHYFAPNALNRFALGTKNKSLKYGDDGSLTIYLGHKSPGEDKESNWLPAPAGKFSLWLRAGSGDPRRCVETAGDQPLAVSGCSEQEAIVKADKKVHKSEWASLKVGNLTVDKLRHRKEK